MSHQSPGTEPPRAVKRRRGAAPSNRAPDECAVCLSGLQDPLVTPCGHSFCRRCLTQYLDFGRTRSPAPIQPKPCPTCAAPLPQLEAAYPNIALRTILAGRPTSAAPALSSALDISALSDAAASALLGQLLERRSAGQSSNAAVGAEVVLAFLARARRTRRRAREDAARDIALIDEDLLRILHRKPGAGAGLGEELASEIQRAKTETGDDLQTGQRRGAQPESVAEAVRDESSSHPAAASSARAQHRLNAPQETLVESRRRSTRSRSRLVEPAETLDPPPRTSGSPSAAAEADELAEVHTPPCHVSPRFAVGRGVNSTKPSPAEVRSLVPAASRPLSPARDRAGDVPSLNLETEAQLLPTKATLAEIYSRTALIDRFHDDVQAMYFERRSRMGTAGLDSVSDTLVRATSLSAARRRASVKHIDILNSPHSLLSAVQFNKQGSLFAAAGVSKRIKLFDFDSLLVDQDGLHCPLREMPCTSKLTSLAWSRDSSSLLAAGTFNGAVTLHDVEANAQVHQFSDHGARTWSVDFAAHHPALLLSGSDDKTVRLWDTGLSRRGTLTLPAKASVCSVKFNPYASHELAFGCADHNVYSYDIRHPRTPICVFEGHWRAVSYVHFLNRSDLVSASTDSSCKLWNVREQEPGLSYGGHVNERNFVGLCGDGDFFACGSEDNAVYVYHKALTGPVVRYGLESSGSFVSSVCWKSDSNLLVAANNIGTIEVIELV